MRIGRYTNGRGEMNCSAGENYPILYVLDREVIFNIVAAVIDYCAFIFRIPPIIVMGIEKEGVGLFHLGNFELNLKYGSNLLHNRQIGIN